VRVLAVGNMYPPHHLGGYELVWQSAVRHLRGLGHEVRVVTTDTRFDHATDSTEQDVHRDLRWWWRDHELPRVPLRERVAVERHDHAALARHLAELRPDVVTWWAMGGMPLSLIESVRRAGLPAVGFVHDDWMVYGPHVDAWTRIFDRRPWARRAGERAFGIPTAVDLDNAARWVFVSETTLASALSAGRRPADVGIAHSGIDPGYLDPRPERPWSWRMLYVGRIDERKGIASAIEALTHLPAEASLTIVGEGNRVQEREFGELAARLGVADRVRREPQRSREELKDIYEAADVVVFPVVWSEPWGLVPLEAMALGRPVVATGRGGSGEYLVDGENALLHEAGDAAALAAAVTRLAGDPALRARLREGGFETAPLHTEDVFNAAVAEEVARACA
jgi:glycosyltransferase involved in cell wall biosynthesis